MSNEGVIDINGVLFFEVLKVLVQIPHINTRLTILIENGKIKLRIGMDVVKTEEYKEDSAAVDMKPVEDTVAVNKKPVEDSVAVDEKPEEDGARK